MRGEDSSLTISVESAALLLYKRAAEDPQALESVFDVALLTATAKVARDDTNLSLAIVIHQRSLELCTPEERVRALVSYGATLRRVPDLGEAMARVDEAIEYDPDPAANYAAYTCRVAVLRQLGDVAEAKELADMLFALRPTDFRLLRARGAVYSALSTDMNDEAWREADRCFALAQELEVLESLQFDAGGVASELERLVQSALAVSDRSETYCQFEAWREQIRPPFRELAKRQLGLEPQSREAFQAKRNVLYAALRACRDCGKLDLRYS